MKPIALTLSTFAPSAPSLVAPLRVAIGLASAYRRQEVRILLCDEGILHALKERNPDWLNRYLTSAAAHGVEVWVDQSSLEGQELTPDQLHTIAQVKPTDEFWSWRCQALDLAI